MEYASTDDSSSGTTKQLYRANVSTEPALVLLEREDLTTQDIIHFCQQQQPPPTSITSETTTPTQAVYRKRRLQVQALLRKIPTGEARVNADGRLVPHDPRAPPAMALPPPPNNPPPAVAAQAQAQANNNNNNNNNNAWLDPDEQDREWIAQGEREAAAAVRRVWERWQAEEENDDTNDNNHNRVFVVPLRHGEPGHQFTFRRVCYAVITIVGCFTAVMLQTLPSQSSYDTTHPDKALLDELLHLRPLATHVRHCPQMERTENPSHASWWWWWWWWWWQPLAMTTTTTDNKNCANGVLYIPRKIPHNDAIPRPFQVSWFLPCAATVVENAKQNATTCASTHRHRCFRGIHDAFLSGAQINRVLEYGGRLILQGGDHYDIHEANHDPMVALPEALPDIVQDLQNLLVTTYRVRPDIQPVAFRVGAEGPMDGTEVPRLGIQSAFPKPVKLLNLTNYVQYVEQNNRRNNFAQFSLPWPFRIAPYRDECHLLSDMQVDDRFAIHTMIFLSDGAGGEFRGGQGLYIDDHPSNRNPRRKIRRGVVIDGARGRLVVSTGGGENRRCRLPIRAGVRAALQIWWN